MTSRTILPRTPSDTTLALPGGGEVAVELRRHARARRWSLRYDLSTDRVRLVLPKRGSARAALAWAAEKAEWIEGQRAKQEARVALVPGATIPFRGADVALVHDSGRTRRVSHEDGRLVVGGPEAHFEGRLVRWLREEARRLLSADSEHYAALAKVNITRVGVGDARTRWGSCSSEGSLRYSWRLVLMPDEVRRYVAAHEIAHRRHMDHGPQFHALEAQLYEGNVAAARRLLRAWGERVRLVG